jgi:hypothetical protein
MGETSKVPGSPISLVSRIAASPKACPRASYTRPRSVDSKGVLPTSPLTWTGDATSAAGTGSLRAIQRSGEAGGSGATACALVGAPTSVWMGCPSAATAGRRLQDWVGMVVPGAVAACWGPGARAPGMQAATTSSTASRMSRMPIRFRREVNLSAASRLPKVLICVMLSLHTSGEVRIHAP